MKKHSTIYAAAAIAAAALLCSACGDRNADTGNAQEPEQTQDTKVTSDTASETEDVQDNDTAQIGETNTNTDNTNDSAEPSSDENVSADGISIEFETVENNETAEDGTVIYTSSYNKPTVTIDGSEAVSQKINDDLQSRIDDFIAANLVDEAKQDYEMSMKEEYTFMEYSQYLNFDAKRTDTNVISFTITESEFSGGAHGMNIETGVNYDTKTGEIIAFDSLSDDPAKFHDETLAFNKELAKTDEYKERLFEDDMIQDIFETTLYGENKWYLSGEGLVFISNPYELGPYASGAIEFTVPYDELVKMGLKEQYMIP